MEMWFQKMYKGSVHPGIECEQTVCHQQMEALAWVGQRGQMGELQSVKVKQQDNSDSEENIKTKENNLFPTLPLHKERRKAFCCILMLFCDMDLMLTL